MGHPKLDAIRSEMETEVWSRLPNDLLEKVQLQLKCIDIQRLRQVSKSWNALVHDSDFVRKHRTLHKCCCYERTFLLSCDSTPKCSFDPTGVPFFQVRNVFQLWLLNHVGTFFKLPTPEAKHIPDTLPCRYLRACSSGMTLILAYDTGFRTGLYYVWNPCSRVCHQIGSPNMYTVLLDGLIVDQETQYFVAVVVGRIQPQDKLVATLIFDSERRQEGWQRVHSNFPVARFDRIRGPLSCSKHCSCNCSWLIEEATEREQRFLSTYFTTSGRWQHEQVEKEIDWIVAPACGSLEPQVSGFKRNRAFAVTDGGSGGCFCVLTARRDLWVKPGREAEWRTVQRPASASDVLSTAFSFHLVL